MNEEQALVIIIGAATITQGLRYIGLTVGNMLPTTGRMGAFLNAVPIAILTALVAPGIFSNDTIVIAGSTFTVIAAYITKNMLVAMIVGMIVVVILRHGWLF